MSKRISLRHRRLSSVSIFRKIIIFYLILKLVWPRFVLYNLYISIYVYIIYNNVYNTYVHHVAPWSYLINWSSSVSSSSSGGDGPETASIGRPKCWSSSASFSERLSTLRAFLHSLDIEPCRLKNSFESNPGPLLDIKMAELMRCRCFRIGGFWCTWKESYERLELLFVIFIYCY